MTRRKPIAELLPELRALRGLSQSQLAAKSGVKLRTICDIEQGASTDPKASTLARLASELRVTMGQLYGTEPMRARGAKQ